MDLFLENKESKRKIFNLKFFCKAKCGIGCLRFQLLGSLSGEEWPKKGLFFFFQNQLNFGKLL